MLKVEAAAEFTGEDLFLGCVATDIHAHVVQHISNGGENYWV